MGKTATRYIGDTTIRVQHVGDGEYAAIVEVDEYEWPALDLFAPAYLRQRASDIDLESPEMFDRIAAAAVTFGSYYTTHNRGDDLPDWAPEPEVADAIETAVGHAMFDDGGYEIRRRK